MAYLWWLWFGSLLVPKIYHCRLLLMREGFSYYLGSSACTERNGKSGISCLDIWIGDFLRTRNSALTYFTFWKINVFSVQHVFNCDNSCDIFHVPLLEEACDAPILLFSTKPSSQKTSGFSIPKVYIKFSHDTILP
jgi:5-hydroxyisourate hydrolase-like protein (transthyretin family)